MPDPRSDALAVSTEASRLLATTLNFDSLVSLRAARGERLPRTSRPQVITVSAPAPLAKLGTIGLYIAPKGSDLLDRIAQASSPPQPERLEELRLELLASYGSQRPVPAPEAVELLIQAPALLEFRYGAKVLVEDMALPGNAAFGMGLFPHAGGPLDLEKFSIIEYPREPDGPGYEALVIVSPPELTDFERDLLGKIPAADTEMLISEDEVGFAPAAATLLLLTIAATAMHTPTIGGGEAIVMEARELDELTMTPELADRLGDRLAVKEMVNMRRRLFSKLQETNR